jgi:hypothetical protein
MHRFYSLIFSSVRAAVTRLRTVKGRLWELSMLAMVCLCEAAFFAGCTDASLARARNEIALGNYASAHQYFAGAAANSNQLSPANRREVMDGLCLTEYRIGAPVYPLTQQLRSCAAALNEPGSKSAQMFADVARQQRAYLTKLINTAVAQKDIAGADDAILRYRSTPGSNPELVAEWTRRLWTIVNRDSIPKRAELTATISILSRQFRPQKNMSAPQFRRWIKENMTVDGNLMVSDVEIGKHTVDLWLGDNQLANAALNLDRFARVNDGLVARCRCNARTNVALKDSGLPAYLVRLDAESRQSEVLIFDQP